MLGSPIEDIKNRLDIVKVIGDYIKLEKAGANYRARCPFHGEKTPSFFISPARQIWHCFGACSEGGDMFKFVMKIEGVEFGDALRLLAQKAGVTVHREDPQIRTERQRLQSMCELACRFFEKHLAASTAGKEAKEYLVQRGMTTDTITTWRVGYAPDAWQGLSDFLVGRGYQREEIAKAGLALQSERATNFYDRFRGRIMFPIFDAHGQVIGFGGRIFKQTRPDEAKYMNTPNTMLYDKSRVLYGLHRASMPIRKQDTCILVEGYIDVIMAAQAGFENVVATSGTALTPFQLRLLKRYSDNVVTAFDMDVAGDSATKRGIALAQASGFNIKVVTMPPGNDPADLIVKNPTQWQQLLKGAKTIHDFYFQTTLAQFDKATLEGKKAIAAVLLPVIKRIPQHIEQATWIKNLAQVLDVSEEAVMADLKNVQAETVLFEQEPETATVAPETKKTRAELLEEHLGMLLLKRPIYLQQLTEDILRVLSGRALQLISFLKKQPATTPPAAPPAQLADLVSMLSLRADVITFSNERDIEQEFATAVQALKKLAIQKTLTLIAQDIKKAEAAGDEQQLMQLMQQFVEQSRNLTSLEKSVMSTQQANVKTS